MLVANRHAHVSVQAHVNTSGIRGAVTYRDQRTGLRFRSTAITSFVVEGDTATITGTGKANGSSVAFVVTARDASPDRFSIRLSNGYAMASSLSGNVLIDGRCT